MIKNSGPGFVGLFLGVCASRFTMLLGEDRPNNEAAYWSIVLILGAVFGLFSGRLFRKSQLGAAEWFGIILAAAFLGFFLSEIAHSVTWSYLR